MASPAARSIFFRSRRKLFEGVPAPATPGHPCWFAVLTSKARAKEADYTAMAGPSDGEAGARRRYR